MKHIALGLLAALLLCGCQYKAPLTMQHNIPVDPALLGLWEAIPDDAQATDKPARLMVLKYSDTEYLIHYTENKNAMYFRGYAIKAGDMPCFQLQAVGTETGPVDADAKDLFLVASCELANGELVVKTLNTELVSKQLENSDALLQAFLKNKDNKDLFTNPGKFKKVK